MAQPGIKDIASGRSDIFQIDPRLLHTKPGWNSREDDDPANVEHIATLARSISAVGVKEPLTVYMEDGKPFVSDGHCRLKAALQAIALGAELATVPVKTENRYASEAERVLSQLVRNAGKSLTPLEQSRVYKRLLDLGWSETEIAEKTGKSRAYVVQLLELQSAPAAVRSMVAKGEVSATLASQVMRSEGSGATETLETAVAEAKVRGKRKATAKDVSKRRPTPMERAIAVNQIREFCEAGTQAHGDEFYAKILSSLAVLEG